MLPNPVFCTLTFRQICRKVSARRRHGGLGLPQQARLSYKRYACVNEKQAKYGGVFMPVKVQAIPLLQRSILQVEVAVQPHAPITAQGCRQDLCATYLTVFLLYVFSFPLTLKNGCLPLNSEKHPWWKLIIHFRTGTQET